MQTHTILWPMSYSRKVSGVSETHSSMTTMNLWGFGKKKNLTRTQSPTYNTIPYIWLASPLQVLHPELLYSTQQLTEIPGKEAFIYTQNALQEYIATSPQNLIKMFTVCAYSKPDKLRQTLCTVLIHTTFMWRKYIKPYSSPTVLHSAPCGLALIFAIRLPSCHIGQLP